MSGERVTISAEDYGLLVFCAVSYDRRLPNGHVPVRMWDALPQEWKNKINEGGHRETRWEQQSAGDRLLDALTSSVRYSSGGDWRPARHTPSRNSGDGADS